MPFAHRVPGPFGRRPGFVGFTVEQRAKQRRAAFARAMAPVLDELRAAGIDSNRETAAELNRRGVPSETGRPWNLQAVGMLRHRIAALEAAPALFRAPAVAPGAGAEG